jgi:hypothetical protein
MPELEEFSALVGDIYDASFDPTLRRGVFSSWAPKATPGFTDRFEKGSGEILDIIKVPQTRILRRSCNVSRSDR